MRIGLLRPALAASSLLAVVLALAPAAGAHSLIHNPKHKLGATTSTNWSGYSVDGSDATAVSGSWTVQPSQCATKGSSWSSPWVGIDGDTSATVEQTGTDSDCSHGTPSYYAWWEMYPQSVVKIPDLLTAGDQMTASVTYNGSAFVLRLVDHTGNWSFSTTQTSSKALRSSVEWIVEGPSSGTLTDFGTLSFSADSATIGGQTSSLDGFGASANQITMATKKGVVKAAPGPVGKGGGFSDTWQSG